MIDPQILPEIAEAATDPRVDAGALRQRFSGIHFTLCSVDDVNPRYTPAYESSGHELYLYTGQSGHCLEITGDFGCASGIVVAAKGDD